MQINRNQPSLYQRDSTINPTSVDRWPLERWLEELGLPDNTGNRIALVNLRAMLRHRMPWLGRRETLWYLKGLDLSRSYLRTTLGPPAVLVPFRRTRQIPCCIYYARVGMAKVEERFRAAIRRAPQTSLNSIMPKLQPLRLTRPVQVLECRYVAAWDTWIDDSRLLSVLGPYTTQYIIMEPPAGWGSQSEGHTPSPAGMHPWVLAGIVAAAIAIPLAIGDDDDDGA